MVANLSFDELFEVCPVCEGTGVPPVDPKRPPRTPTEDCAFCKGQGGKLTDRGEAIAQLLRVANG